MSSHTRSAAFMVAAGFGVGVGLVKAQYNSSQKVETEQKHSQRDPSRVHLEHELSNAQVRRYGRQLILPEFGPDAQDKLCKSSVLVVGAGGLGAPILHYLAAAGVGRIGIVDGDTVDIDNLHRQVIHSEKSVGVCKAVSARRACLELNSSIEVTAYTEHLSSNNAMEIAQKYDILVSATDNVPARYLVNDVSVLLHKPHVSGSALRLEGQLTVYHHNGGPCYRCLYPTPPPANTVTNCSDGGVLGAVPGAIGCLQALEVLKIASGMKADVMSGRMLLFDAGSNRYMNIKLRPRDPACAVCGDEPTVLAPVDYAVFCSSRMDDKPVAPEEEEEDDVTAGWPISVSCPELFDCMQKKECMVILDVRNEVQFRIASLPYSLHIPMNEFIGSRTQEASASRLQEALSKAEAVHNTHTRQAGVEQESTASLFVLCRRGIDSLRVARLLRAGGAPFQFLAERRVRVQDVSGGLERWARQVDPDFPVY